MNNRMLLHRMAVLALSIALFGSARFRAADTVPRELTNDAFWGIVSGFSEEGGYFRFQFMSNELEFPTVIPALKQTVRTGGVYLGVGPEQNFSYIAATQPKIAFIFDIRPENMLEHLIYKAIFESSSNRVEFVSRLFSRKAPPGLTDKSTVRAIFQAFSSSRPDAQLFNQNLQAIRERLVRNHHFVLKPKDEAEIDDIYRTIFDAGPGFNYGGGFGGFRGSNYAAMMTATDNDGRAWSYLATEENFQTVRDMQLRNVIIPLVGDFAGSKAIRSVASYLKAHGAVVSTFYTSNVEQYLFQQGTDWRRFYTNVSMLPVDASSTFIRSSHFAYDPAARRTIRFAGSNYVMLLCSIKDLTKAFTDGAIKSYESMIMMSHD
jgi:hypothetical protein